MSGEIKIVYEEILNASRVFDQRGKEYADIVPKSIGEVPTVSEGSLRQALGASLQAIAALHDALGSSMRSHGRKLKHVHDAYRNKEDDLSDLFKLIDDPSGIYPS